MESENKVCPVCSGKLLDNGLCPECNINFSHITSQTEETGKKSLKKFLKGIVFFALAVIVGIAGNFLTDKKDIEAELNAYIEKTSHYVPGKVDGEVYTSKTFGIEFNKNKRWKMFTDDELKVVSQGTRESFAGTAMKEMEKQKVGKDLKKKYEESIYIETEMAAVYMKDDTYIGQVELTVLGAYGLDDITSAEYAKSQKQALTDIGIKDVKMGKEVLSGNECDVVYARIDQDGDVVKARFYLTKKDGMMCMVSLQYLDEYEDTVIKEFENALK